MKRLIFTLFFALLVGGASYADQIQYDTSAGSVFNCLNSASLTGCGTNAVTLGDTIVLTYVPAVTGVTVSFPNFPSSNTNFGNLVVSCLGGGTACGQVAVPTGLTLSIEINQTVPDVLSGIIPVGTISGSSLSGTSSSAFILWNQGTSVALIGTTLDDTYSIQNTLLGLSAPNSGGGQTSIQGQIVAAAAVPEPAISLLFASGLVAIGSIRRKR
jgi:hypothetical protein